ncbi:3460_t:CDS:2 [Ambispora gerdemannii]|uniref:3460_t:CDS:1 n=1 Tax=Ambispora gerdemannii TaxID=144530 RepID=A0A9N8V8H5_9GLOM|nr:3460_t:CDS:2 [Ambispora gerdemannii]
MENKEEELLSMAYKVQRVLPERPLQEILIDLQKTLNVEVTITRILNGTFLQGTLLDPSEVPLSVVQNLVPDYGVPNPNTNIVNQETVPRFDLKHPNCSVSSLCSGQDFADDNASNFRFSFPYSPIPQKERDHDSFLDFEYRLNKTSDSEKNNSAILSGLMDQVNALNTIECTSTNDRVNDKIAESAKDVQIRIECTNATIQVNDISKEPAKLVSSPPVDFLIAKTNDTEATLKTAEKEPLKRETRGRKRKILEGSEANTNVLKSKTAENVEKQRKKEELRLERQRVKEACAAEKARAKELQEANKRKTDKLEAIKEIIVDVESKLMAQPLGPLLINRFQEMPVNVNIMPTNIANIISWRRKVKAEWKEEFNAYIPVPEYIKEERHVLYYLPIAELCSLIETNALQSHHITLKDNFPDKQIIYLIEGHEEYCRKKKTQQNRIFNEAVRLGIEGGPATAKKNKNKTDEHGPNEDKVEDELIWLQVDAECLIIHAKNLEESSKKIFILTGDIAKIPYKNEGLNFCVENAIRSGVDDTDTWQRTLQAIPSVTEPIASAIVRKYPTIRSFYSAYFKCHTIEEEELLLSKIEIASSGLGHSSRFINKPLSKKIYDIFMEQDPDALIQN